MFNVLVEGKLRFTIWEIKMSDCDKCKDKKCGDEQSGKPTFSDRFKDIHGALTITVRDAKTNEIERVVDTENLIMTFLRFRMSYLFAGVFLPAPADPDTNESYISQLQVGTSGIAETVTDAAITNPVTITPLEVTYPSAYSVQFTGILASGSGNGLTFREAGLVFGNPVQLATRKTFASMEKSSLWIWEINWVLAFS